MKTQVTVRLSDVELAQLDVLRLNGSRDGYFRSLIPSLAERRARINEAAISGFVEAARAAREDGMDASEYDELISEYERELAILRRREG